MGSVRRRARREARERRAKQQAESEHSASASVTADNSPFQKYYQAQRILPKDEWPLLLRFLHRPLPACLRFSPSPNTEQLLERLQSFCSSVRLHPLPWAGTAVQLALDKGKLRKHVELQAWVQRHTECGDITRQEAVSMVPALLLEARGDEWLLDMCAAPGSKTGQLLEVVAQHQGNASQGLVLANELDTRRAQMLVHQCRRLHTEPLIVTCHAAQHLPRQLDGCFHRVLADVPCSGDGTLRKNKRIWSTWSPKNAVSLHSTQLQILTRALQMCRAGGRVVYSTCSLNPIENEAVIAEVLRQAHGGITLVDVSSLLPALKRRPGLSQWAVPRGGRLLWELPKGQASSVFAPSKVEVRWMCLERCIRIYPHLQDTGGFFVAVLQRTDTPQPENACAAKASRSVAAEASPKSALVWYSPFEEHPGWPAVRQRYNLPHDLAASQLLMRNGCANVVYFVNKSLASLLMCDNHGNLKHGNCGLGVPVFEANHNGDYHITQTGLQALLPLLGKSLLIRCGRAGLTRVLEGMRQDRHVERSLLPPKLQRCLDKVGLGGAALLPKQHGVDALAIVVKQRNLRLLLSEAEVLRLHEQLAPQKDSKLMQAIPHESRKRSKQHPSGGGGGGGSKLETGKRKRRRKDVKETVRAQQQVAADLSCVGPGRLTSQVPKHRRKKRKTEK